jgi:hypothetical protein
MVNNKGFVPLERNSRNAQIPKNIDKEPKMLRRNSNSPTNKLNQIGHNHCSAILLLNRTWNIYTPFDHWQCFSPPLTAQRVVNQELNSSY